MTDPHYFPSNTVPGTIPCPNITNEHNCRLLVSDKTMGASLYAPDRFAGVKAVESIAFCQSRGVLLRTTTKKNVNFCGAGPITCGNATQFVDVHGFATRPGCSKKDIRKGTHFAFKAIRI